MDYSDSDAVDIMPPPIVTYDIGTDDEATEKCLKRMLKHEFCLKRQKDAVYFYTQSKEDYDTLIKFLQFYDHGYYTYRPQWHNTQLIVLKNYPACKASEITTNLKKRGVKCLGVHIMSRRPVESIDFPPMLLTLDGNTDLDKVRRIRHLDNIGGFTWSDYASDRYTPMQCHRCQRFKHDSRFCFMPPNCHTCGEEHWSEECQKKKKSSRKCFNCKGNHRAYDVDCPEWIAYKGRLVKARKRAEREVKNEQSRAVVSYPIPKTETCNMSWSELLGKLEEISNRMSTIF